MTALDAAAAGVGLGSGGQVLAAGGIEAAAALGPEGAKAAAAKHRSKGGESIARRPPLPPPPRSAFTMAALLHTPPSAPTLRPPLSPPLRDVVAAPRRSPPFSHSLAPLGSLPPRPLPFVAGKKSTQYETDALPPSVPAGCVCPHCKTALTEPLSLTWERGWSFVWRPGCTVKQVRFNIDQMRDSFPGGDAAVAVLQAQMIAYAQGKTAAKKAKKAAKKAPAGAKKAKKASAGAKKASAGAGEVEEEEE
jgi:hypothetical protein